MKVRKSQVKEQFESHKEYLTKAYSELRSETES